MHHCLSLEPRPRRLSEKNGGRESSSGHTKTSSTPPHIHFIYKTSYLSHKAPANRLGITSCREQYIMPGKSLKTVCQFLLRGKHNNGRYPPLLWIELVQHQVLGGFFCAPDVTSVVQRKIQHVVYYKIKLGSPKPGILTYTYIYIYIYTP